MTNPKAAYTKSIAHDLCNKHFVEIDWLNHYFTEQELWTAEGNRTVLTTPWIVVKFKEFT
jgi:hypothetical protein